MAARSQVVDFAIKGLIILVFGSLADAAGQASLADWRGQPFGTYPNAANLGAPTLYQWWYRDPTSACSGAGFNFTNAWTVTWMP